MTDTPVPPDDGSQRDYLQRALGDGFAVRELLGRGGFAEVFAAEDLRLKRMVAIKVLRPDVASPALVERFRREAEAAAQLRHPHIVPIYAVGEGVGLAWIIMPLIEGESLRQRLDREGALPVAEAWRITREVAGALAAAHRRGIVHRDIKPDNIMLDGEERRALVMDFGIAKAMGGADEGLTGTGMVIGTAQYMSPEQASGERSIDHRSDQYALAIVAYQMLTGHVPFDGDSFQTIVYRQVAEMPVPVQEVNPAVPPPLAQAITRALAKPPASRYSSSEEFVRALDEARPAESIGPSAASPSLDVAERVSPRLRLGAGVFGALALAGYVATYGRIDPWAAAPAHVSRGEALAAARTFLVQQGATGYYREASVFEGRDSLQRFLHYALGPGEGVRWTDSVLPARHWDVRWFRFGEREQWRTQVGVDGRIHFFAHTAADSAASETPVADSTLAADRVAAEAFLAARGWTVATLERVPDSSAQPIRNVHRFLWRVPGQTVAWRPGGEVGRHHLRVDVRSGQVTNYLERVTQPQGFRDVQSAHRNDALERGSSFAVLLVFLVPLVVAVVRLARGGGHQLRWRAATTLVVVCSLAVLLNSALVWPATLHELKLAGTAFDLISSVGTTCVGILIAALACLLIGTAADDLGRTAFPGCDAGALELGQGRWRTPAVARAWMTGYGIAGVMALGAAVQVMFMSGRPGTWPDSVGVDRNFNLLLPLTPVTVGMPGAYAAAFLGLAIAVALHKLTGRRLWLAAALGWLLMSVLGVQGRSDWLPNAVFATVGVGLFVAALKRFGLLAFAFGVFVYFAVSNGAQLLGAASAGYMAAGIVTLAFAAVPAVLGILAQRHLASRPGGVTTPNSPSTA